MEKRVLAFDFGASSGRAMCGTYNGSTIEIKELHRFSNDPVIVNGTMYWDVLRLLFEIKQGLIKSKKCGKIDSLGIDTWGVDFGLIDKEGNLLENPVHYRDARTEGMIEKSFEIMDKGRFYEITGNQFMELNTVFQLLSLSQNRPELLKRTDQMLLMPDLFNYFLTGHKTAEYSIASTTQLMDANTGKWSGEVVNQLALPKDIFPPIIPCGTKLGTLTDEICEELDMNKIDVIAVAGHDTQCAMAAVPAKEDDFIFLSCGTWSLLGTELERPLINEKTQYYNITNEGGYGRKASFLKNITGLWCIQESRRQWMREGEECSFEELEMLAVQEEPMKCFIDIDDPLFVAAGNIPRRIRQYCERTNQRIPNSKGEIIRCINESLAYKYRQSVEEIMYCTEKSYDTIYMVGGGTQSRLLCQLTANICNCKVSAGPIEATVLGNIALQLLTLGDIKTIKEAREIIVRSSEIEWYEPKDIRAWDEGYKKYKQCMRMGT